MFRPICNIISLKKSVIIAFTSSDSHLLRFDDEFQDLCLIKTDTNFNHDKRITDFATFPEKNLIVSGGLDGFIKVWNMKRELIREIKFPEPVYSVSFLNTDADIIVGHLGKVSTVSHKDYMPNEIPKLYQPSQEDVDSFYEKKKSLVTDSTFAVLKRKDDDIKK